jgi:hypothetical protein
VNKYRFTIPENDGYINIPVEIKWDYYGRDTSIEKYERSVLEEIIGSPKDFEITRFSHESHTNNTRTDINYEFNFFDNTPGTGENILVATTANWEPTYLNEGFNSEQIYYYEKPFTKSFFKMDFYDTNDTANQTLYFTIIIPVQQGGTESVSISPIIPDVNIRIPSFKLDFVGDKEGFFIYWLRDRTDINISTFYMSAKFFNGRIGGFMRMMTEPQSTLPNKFLFDTNKYFFYKVVLDYDKYSYSVFNSSGTRVGTSSSIKWYEYVNQP